MKPPTPAERRSMKRRNAAMKELAASLADAGVPAPMINHNHNIGRLTGLVPAFDIQPEPRVVLLPSGTHFIRTTGDNAKQHGRILFAADNDFGPFARVELLSWDTGEKVSEVLLDRSMLLECEFFADDLAARYLDIIDSIKADFRAKKKTETSA